MYIVAATMFVISSCNSGQEYKDKGTKAKGEVIDKFKKSVYKKKTGTTYTYFLKVKFMLSDNAVADTARAKTDSTATKSDNYGIAEIPVEKKEYDKYMRTSTVYVYYIKDDHAKIRLADYVDK